MIFLFSLVGLALSAILIFSEAATFILAACQLSLLVAVILRRNVSATGAFLFMSFLFYGIRPVYMVLEDDYDLLKYLFLITPGLTECNWAMWWATLGSVGFLAGSDAFKAMHLQSFTQRSARLKRQLKMPLVTDPLLGLLLCLQVISLLIMATLTGGSLYGSSLGAYLYDLPILLQSGHIFAMILIFERYLKSRSAGALLTLLGSGLLFLVITWQMREITMFRGFYITGLMVAGIAGLARLKPRVSYLWLILPILVLLPTFRDLGENRYVSNEELSSKLESQQESFVTRYWHFFDGRGDMNIFDSFVAAKAAAPSHHPYVLSWLYVPVHFVPRALWSSKPEQGLLVDHSFSNGAPYSPGIAGYFVLDGGLTWMFLCMVFLGYLVGGADLFVFSMAPGYLRCCLQGILAINALYLTRFLLWQSFYQILYAIIPCIALDYLIQKKRIKKAIIKPNSRERASNSAPSKGPVSSDSKIEHSFSSRP